MRRQIRSAIALVVGVVSISLLSSGPAALGQGRQLRTADTGVVMLGQNRILRVTVVAVRADEPINVQFTRQFYEQGPCNGDGVCKLSIVVVDAFPLMKLAPGEAAAFTANPNPAGCGQTTCAARVSFRVSAQFFKAHASVIDAETGVALYEWDFDYNGT